MSIVGRKIVLSGSLAVMCCFMAGNLSAAKMDSDLEELIRTLDLNDKVDVIITLKAKAETASILVDKDEKRKRARLIKSLKGKAEQAQLNVRKILEAHNVLQPRQLWLSNSVAATVPVSALIQLMELNEIESIRLDAKIHIMGPKKKINIRPAPGSELGASTNVIPNAVVATSLAAPGWNGTAIRSSDLWALDYSGEGVTVAIVDSGVDMNHPDLQAAYRGGTNSWFDPNGEHDTPADVLGHGTQVAGLVLGGDADGETIGVAPGANWMAVKIFNDAGDASLSAIHAGYQWLLDPDGDPDTDDAPDVINNSWSLENPGDCNMEFQVDLQILKDAGIAVVFSAGNGNNGAASSTSESPGNNPTATAVGAVDDALSITSFSGRGPSACGGGIYPQIAAPGVDVISADLTFGGVNPYPYTFVSGTSFSAPHLSGALALLKSTNSALTMEQILTAVNDSALDLGAVGTDNDYGWGLLDVKAAYDLLNLIPVANLDILGVQEDTSAGVNVAANDVASTIVDVSNIIDETSVIITTQPLYGSASVDVLGFVTYTPDSDYFGLDQFSYTVKDSAGVASNVAIVDVTVTAVNDAPVANTDSVSTTENTAVIIDVLNNDADLDGDTLSVSAVTQGAYGVVTINSGANVTYAPTTNFNGSDSFSYTITDGNGGITTANVTINVMSEVNSSPASSGGCALNTNSEFDPMLPLLIFSSLFYLRRRPAVDCALNNSLLQTRGKMRLTHHPVVRYKREVNQNA